METDRISLLPDCLLAKILLYLSISDIVKTSVLSKRWKFLWFNVPELDLNAIDFLPYDEALPSLMDRFLEFNRGLCLQKFKIKFANFEKRREDHDDIDHMDCSKRGMEWIAEFVHRGVKHLEVETEYLDFEKKISNIENDVAFMPKYMYVSKTLVSLKLVNVGLEDTKFDVSLPCLKNMHLENIYYKSDGLVIIKRFILGSTLLEDLTMDFPVSTKYQSTKKRSLSWGEFIFSELPRCLSSTLEYVKINKLRMKDEGEIKVVNYFLENSRILKKMSLSLGDSSIQNQEPESYMKLLTSKKLSSGCQVLFY